MQILSFNTAVDDAFLCPTRFYETAEIERKKKLSNKNHFWPTIKL